METSSPVQTKGKVITAAQKFYKTKFFWVGIIISLMVIGAALAGWYWRREGFTKKMTIEGWHALVVQSDKVGVELKRDPAQADRTAVSRELHNLDSLIKDRKFIATQVPRWLNNEKILDDYTKYLANYGVYAARAAEMSDDLKLLKTEDFEKLTELGKSAQTGASTLRKQLSYLTEEISPAAYGASDFIKAVKQAADDATAKAEQEKTAQQKAAEKDVLDKQTVESNISSFMAGFVAADAPKMKRYMTDAFAKEYNFNILSSENRQYSYPVSFRIVETKKKDANYEAYVNVVYKYRDGSGNVTTDQYASSTVYVLSFSPKSNTWLINLEKSSGPGGY